MSYHSNSFSFILTHSRQELQPRSGGGSAGGDVQLEGLQGGELRGDAAGKGGGEGRGGGGGAE